MSQTNADQYYQNDFIPMAHRLGSVTLLAAIIMSLLPGIYLSFVQGYFPGFDIILQVFIVIAAYVAVIWIIEPITYFPMLGVCGSYMGFLSGNIGNMRLPIAVACQQAVDAPLGSKKAEVAAILGIGISVLVNLIFVVILVVAGTMIITNLPEAAVTAIKTFTPVSIYAAVFIMFFNAAHSNLYRIIAVLLAAVILLVPADFLNQPFNVAYAGIGSIVIGLLVARWEFKKMASDS